LWSFGHPEQGWNFGTGIAGWGGNSAGWKPVEFDLSDYKSDRVIIRFAFASDKGFCTVDDSLVMGLFLDDITIIDGSDILFQDDGEFINTMNRSGYGIKVADWIHVKNGVGSINPNESTNVDLFIETQNLYIDNYSGLLRITSNDTTQPEIDVQLNVKINPQVNVEAVSDGVPNQWLLAQNYPNPFSTSGLYTTTTIEFQVLKQSDISLQLFNVLGKKVATLVDEHYQPGKYKVVVNASNLANGVYFYKISCNSFEAIRKLLLVQ
jgi:hypothetical protein